jgi:hypothetical protein
MRWIVKLESGVWLANGDGDPPRTIVCANARAFPTYHAAESGLWLARTFRPFADAEITEVNAE